MLTTPVIRCLKLQLPSAEIHFITKKQYVSILETNPYIDKLHVLNDSLHTTLKQLRSESYDVIIDLHNNLRTHIIKTYLGVTCYSFNKLNFAKWMLVNTKFNHLPKVHIVQRYLQAAAPLGVVDDGKGLDYFLPTTLNIETLHLPDSFIAIAIGGQHATKRLPLHKLKELANSISSPIVLLGGKEDIQTAELITATNPSNIQNFCGSLSLHQSAYVLSKAATVVTHDTGLMHIAAAFQRQIVSIWGNTIPEFGMTPYYGNFEIRNSKFEIKNLHCRPCSKIGFAKCPKGHFKCMEWQDIAAIAKAAEV